MKICRILKEGVLPVIFIILLLELNNGGRTEESMQAGVELFLSLPVDEIELETLVKLLNKR